MKKLDENVSRRDFGKLAVAAFGGVVAGSMLGSKLLSADDMKKPAAAKADDHACCGSNACKGQGGTADNSCKGKGSCSVPIKGDGWKKARAHYEASMTKAGKK